MGFAGTPPGSGVRQIVAGLDMFAAFTGENYIVTWGNYGSISAAPSDSGYTAIIPGTSSFTAFKQGTVITLDGVAAPLGGTVTVLQANPTVSIMTVDGMTVNVSGTTNLTLGANTITVEVTRNNTTETYTITANYEYTLPVPNITEITFGQYGGLTVFSSVSNIPAPLIQEIGHITAKCYKKQIDNSFVLISQNPFDNVNPGNSSKWISVTDINISDLEGEGKIEIVVEPATTSTRAARTITIENVKLATVLSSLSISGNFGVSVTTTVPAALATCKHRLMFQVGNSQWYNVTSSSAPSFTRILGQDYWEIDGADAASPYTILGFPFIGELIYISIYVIDETTNVSYSVGAVLQDRPNIANYSSADMAAITAAEINAMIVLRACWDALSVSQIAAMTSANVTAAAALMTENYKSYYNSFTSTNIANVISSALTSSTNSATPAEFATALDYYAALFGNGSFTLSFSVSGANLSRLASGLSTSDNVIMCVARPLMDGVPIECYLGTDRQTAIDNGTKIYVAGGANTQVKIIRGVMPGDDSDTFAYGANNSLTVNGVSVAVGESTVTSMGTLRRIDANLFENSILSAPTITSAGARPYGKGTIYWTDVIDAGSYTVERSADNGATWESLGTTTDTFLDFTEHSVEGLPSSGTTFKFRVRAEPASSSSRLASAYSSVVDFVSTVNPGPPYVAANAFGEVIQLSISPLFRVYEVQVKRLQPSGIYQPIAFGATSDDFTYDSAKLIGTFTHHPSTPNVYHLIDIPLDSDFKIVVREISNSFQRDFIEVDVTSSSLASLLTFAAIAYITPAQFATLSSSQITTIASAPLGAMSLQQLAALPITAVLDASAANAGTASALSSAVGAAVSSSLAVAPTSTGESKTAVDAALRIAAAAQAAVSPTATVTATTLPIAYLTHLNAAGLFGNAVVVSALAPRSGIAVDCVLTSAQEAAVAADGQLYIAGGTGDKVRFVSENGARSALFEFPGPGQVTVDGVAQTVGDDVTTAFGKIRFLFSGSGGFQGTAAALTAPIITSVGARLYGEGSIYWTAVTNAASYTVEKSADNGATWSTGVTTTNTFLDFNEHFGYGTPSSGALFKFRVRAEPAIGASYTASEYSSIVDYVSSVTPGPPSATVALNGALVDITITPATDGTAVSGYEVQVKRLIGQTSGIYQPRAFGSTSGDLTYDSATLTGTFAYTGTSVVTYSLTDIPLDGHEYKVVVREISSRFQRDFIEIGFTSATLASLPSLISAMPSISQAQLALLSTSQVTSIASDSVALSAMSLQQLAALPVAPVGASSAANAGTAPSLFSAVGTAVSSRLSAAPTSSGESKADVDAALRIASAAQAAVSSSATVTAVTVTNANLTHLSAAGLTNRNAVVVSALAPRAGNTPVDCVLSPAQEAEFANGGQLYMAGSAGDKLRFVSQDGLRQALFEFPGTGQVTIDGVPRSIGSTVTTVFGPIYISFTGSFGGYFVVNTGQAPVCFLADAPVLTPAGYRAISSIAVGDKVRTAAGRDVLVKRVFMKEYAAGPSVNPFVIPKGSFGALRALPISPNHEVMVAGRGMVKAKGLGLPRMKMTGSFVYYNLELEDWVRDNLVVAGVECESLAPAGRIVMSKAEFGRFVRARYGSSAAARLKTVCFEEADGRVSMPKL